MKLTQDQSQISGKKWVGAWLLFTFVSSLIRDHSLIIALFITLAIIPLFGIVAYTFLPIQEKTGSTFLAGAATLVYGGLYVAFVLWIAIRSFPWLSAAGVGHHHLLGPLTL